MQSGGGSVRPAGVELNDPGIIDRIICALQCIWVVRIGYQKTAAAGNRDGRRRAELAIIAARWVVGNDRDRCVEALCLGVPGGLFDGEPETWRNNRGVYCDSGAIVDGITVLIFMHCEKRHKRRILGVIRRNQKLAVGCQRHFVHARFERATRAAGSYDFALVKIDHFERAVAVAHIKTLAVRDDAIRSGTIVVHGGSSFVKFNSDKAADRLLEYIVLSIDDVDTTVGTISEVVLLAFWVDPADVERLEWIARDRNYGQTFSLRCSRCSGALTLGDCGNSCANQQGSQPYSYSQGCTRQTASRHWCGANGHIFLRW